MKEISPNKLDALLAKNIVLNKCTCSAGGGNIIIQMPWYGATGARVECPHCGRKTKLHTISICVTDESRLATPIIEKSMMNGVYHAIADWNERRYEYRGK